MTTQEVLALIDRVEFFAESSDNKLWPTANRWSLKEAKLSLLETVLEAKRSLQIA